MYKGVDGGLEAAASVLVAVEQIERGAARRQKHRVARHGKALEAMTRPTVLILGGKDKGNDYSEILPLVKNKVTAIKAVGVGDAGHMGAEKFHNLGIVLAHGHDGGDLVLYQRKYLGVIIALVLAASRPPSTPLYIPNPSFLIPNPSLFLTPN